MKHIIDEKTIDRMRIKIEEINQRDRLAISRASKERDEMLQKKYELTEKDNSHN